MLILLALLLVILFFGLGFAVHLLWIVAIACLVLWLIGVAVGRGESAGSTGSTAGKGTCTDP